MGGYNFYNGRNKPTIKRGLLSYLLVGMTGAIIGGILVLTLAPAVLLGRALPYEEKPQGSISGDSAGDVSENQSQTVYISQKTGEVPLITAIAKKVMPAVVGIRTTEFQESMFFESKKTEGLGSGVIIDCKGYILTNNHVVSSNTSDISVYLPDGRSVPARVIWTDEGLDLSILKVNAQNLTAAEIGDSDKVEIGELAVAIGNPLGMRFERSVTSGIISALDRTLPVDNEKLMEGLIQTDASINEGNSGGPLINSSGYVIGINTVKVKSAEGMGFAIPINIAAPVIKSIVKTGGFRTPYLGLLSGFDKEIADLYDYNLDRGIYVEGIDKNGPIYKAGMKKGDIILEINDSVIDTVTSLKQAIFTAGAGSEIKVKYLDSSKNQRIVTVKLDEMRGN